MLYRRTIVTLLFVITYYVVVFKLPFSLFVAFISLVVVTSLWELYAMIDGKRLKACRWLGLAYAASLPMLRALESVRLDITLDRLGQLTGELSSGILVLFLLVAMTAQTFKKEYGTAVEDLATTCWGAIYVSWFLSYIIPLRGLPGGPWVVTLLVAMVKINDIFAYLVGSHLGRHKFFPRLSPKKTWEGAVAGIAGSVVGAMIVLPFLRQHVPEMTMIHAVSLGVIMGILSPVGDLCESLIKRAKGHKDSGVLLLGTGGLLDGIDSLVFCTPLFYYFMWWRFGG